MSAIVSHSKPPVAGTLSIARVLELPALAVGEPEVLGGADLLGSPVRWVHVAETPDLSELLSGGELVLTTGMAFGEEGAGVAGFLAQVRAAGAAGLIVESVAGAQGERDASIATLRRVAGRSDFPVILLHQRVRFVEITEVVHRMLVSDQFAALERSRMIHEVFTALSLQNATEEGIVARAAELIGAPVVLEDV